MPQPSPLMPPLYLTGPARRIAAIDDHTARADAAIEAIDARAVELEEYRKLYAETYGVTLGYGALEDRDPYLAELMLIAARAEALAVRPVRVDDETASQFAAMADGINHRTTGPRS